jgi:hypothetical protein
MLAQYCVEMNAAPNLFCSLFSASVRAHGAEGAGEDDLTISYALRSSLTFIVHVYCH